MVEQTYGSARFVRCTPESTSKKSSNASVNRVRASGTVALRFS